MPTLLLIAATCGQLPQPDSTTERLPLTTSTMPPAHSEWYGIYHGGRKIGYRHQEFLSESADGQTRYVLRQEDLGRFNNGSRTVTRREITRTVFAGTAPFDLQGMTVEETVDGNKTLVTFTRGADGTFAAIHTGSGSPRTTALGALDYTLSDALTVRLWARQKPELDQRMRYKHLSVDRLGLVPMLLMVTSVTPGDSGPVYVLDQINLAKRRHTNIRVDATGDILEMTLVESFDFKREPEATARTVDGL